jgi:hypothetical protein
MNGKPQGGYEAGGEPAPVEDLAGSSSMPSASAFVPAVGNAGGDAEDYAGGAGD